jgi:hypothetical protein
MLTRAPEPVGLHFDLAAQQLFDKWRTNLEERLRADGMRNTPAFESHLSKYRSLMPSLALVFHLIDLVDGQTDCKQVSEQATARAVAWCDYLEHHARRIYASETNAGVLAAHTLMEKVEDGTIKHGATVRDIYRTGWEGLSERETVLAGLKVLEQHHILRIVDVETKGRPRAVVHLHPTLRSEL